MRIETMNFVAGIDGGATRTRAVLADTAGRVLGHGISGPSNCGSTPKDKVREHLEEALLQAFRSSDLSPQQPDMLFMGMAGVVSAADAETVRKVIEEIDFLNTKQLEIDHDIRISLAGGLAGQEGIALIVGTGSSCYGRCRNGRDQMAGGWGHLLDDRGSAYDLALRGLIAVVRAADGRGPKTELTGLFKRKLDIIQTHEIMHKVYVKGPSGYPMTKKEIASMATLVSEAAQNGDEPARQIIRDGVDELMLMVKTVAEQLNFRSSPVRLVISGGAINGSSPVKNALYDSLRSSVPEISIQAPVLTPVQGSALLALKLNGVDIDQNIIANLKSAKN